MFLFDNYITKNIINQYLQFFCFKKSKKRYKQYNEKPSSPTPQRVEKSKLKTKNLIEKIETMYINPQRKIDIKTLGILFLFLNSMWIF